MTVASTASPPELAAAGAVPATGGHAKRVAYVMNGFPRLSETFIAHEIFQLERLSLSLRLFSVKRENEPAVQPVVRAIRAPITYLPEATSLSGTTLPAWLWRNLPRFARANAAVFARRPLHWTRTLACALALAWRHRERGASPRLRKVFIKEFLQAGCLAHDVLRAGDVGHLHGHFCHGVATIAWFASRMTGIPFSFTAHAKDIYQRELNPGRLLERKMSAARFVATCTCANADVLRARHPRPADVHTIYHGLDTDWFAPAPSAAPGAAPLILSVGRFVEKKGFEYLVQACHLLAAAGVRFRCTIVGERGSTYESIRRQIAQLGLEAHVQLRDPVAQDELRDIYRGAHVFALPCKVMEDGDRDGFPNVLAEAMAMGVPVVSTRISGIPEMIDDGVHGLLVRSRDAHALADALERILLDATLHRRLAAQGRQHICERFDSRRTTVALRDLFVAELRGTRAAATRADRARA